MKSKSEVFFSIKTGKFVFNHIYNHSPDTSSFHVHTHDVPELIFIKQIDGCHVIEDREYPLSGMDLIIVPPAACHSIKLYSSSPYERYDICFDPGLPGNAFDRIYNSMTVVNCAQNSIISDIFRKADRYAEMFSEDDFENISKLLITEIFYNLTVLDRVYSINPTIVSPILSKALEYINQYIST